MSTEYIDARARQMASGKSAACRNAIEKALAEVKKRLAEGLYSAQNEPLEDLDFLVSHDPACIKRKPALKRTIRKRGSKHQSK
jgi:hypothetical protein